MAKGVYKNVKFKGYYEGKNLCSYTGISKDVLQYSLINDYETRINKVKELLNLDDIGSKDAFWQEVWDTGICKSGLNTCDSLWTETNVCEFLEKLGTYILAKAPKLEKDGVKITVYNDYKLFKRMIEEKEKISQTSDVEDEFLVYKKKDNYKLAPKYECNEDDIEKYGEIKAYHDLKQYFQDLSYNGKDEFKLKESKKFLKETTEKLNKSKCKNTDFKLTESRVYSIAKRNLPLLTDDMNMVKLSKERPIVWKAPLRDSGNEIDWSYLDMFDPIHVKALLQLRREMDICEDALIDLNDLIEKIDLDEELSEILDLWRRDKTLEVISNIMEVNEKTIRRKLDKIVNKVISEYEKQYEEKHYYMNLVKGKYKKCNECGDIKLVKRFDKNGKKGYMPKCKECRKNN